MTTYYVRSSGGDDISNDGLSFANGWATLQFALDQTLAPGDFIYANGTFLLDTQLDNDVNSGDTTQSGGEITLIGCNSSGVVDGTRATIDGTSITAGHLFTIAGGIDYWKYKNLVFQNCAMGDGLYNNTGGHSYHSFVNCRFTGNYRYGVYASSYSNVINLYNCEIDNNGDAGIYCMNVALLEKCSIHHNTLEGIGSYSIYTRMSDCLIYSNGSHGINVYGWKNFCNIIANNTTIYNNGGDGIYCGLKADDSLTFLSEPHLLNVIVANNGGYGINIVTAGIQNKIVMNNIASYGNASGHCNWNGGVIPVTNNLVTSDPDFVSTTAGSEDLTPQNSALAVSQPYPSGGTSYSYIGAIQPQPTAGGGDKYPFPGGRRY